jgi:hypothetical protein
VKEKEKKRKEKKKKIKKKRPKEEKEIRNGNLHGLDLIVKLIETLLPLGGV